LALQKKHGEGLGKGDEGMRELEEIVPEGN
jgi:hypothetical protein